MTISGDFLAHLQSSGLFAGYEPVTGGIRDDLAAFRGANKFLSIRRNGGGQVDPLWGEPTYQVMIGGKQSYTQELEEKSDALIDFVNANYQVGAIFNIVVQSNVVGPLFLSDDRVYFMLNLQISNDRG